MSHGDRALVERRRPVEDLDRRRDRHQEAERREDHRRVDRLPDTNMWWPQTRKPITAMARLDMAMKLVAEDALAREAGHELADHAHRGQDHDVDRRVRVEPEQVLEQDRVAAAARVEEAEVEDALHRHQQDRDRDHRRAQHLDDAGRVVRPDEQRQPEPGQPGRAHLVDGDDEVEAGEDRREAGDEDADRRPATTLRVREGRAVGRVEGPAGVDAARDQRVERERPRRPCRCTR